MKAILTLPSMADPGGVAGFFRSVLPRLAERGVEVSPLEIGSTRGALGVFHPARDQVELSIRLRRERADLLHVNPSLDPRCLLRDGLFVRQALRRGLPVVAFFHGWKTPFEALVEKRLLGFFLRTFGRASIIVVLTDAVASRLRAWGVRAPIRRSATAIPDDLVSGFSLRARQERLASPGTFRILFLARLERAKGIFETLRAVSLLAGQGLDVRLDVAGDGSAAREARALAETLPGLARRVQFHGYVQGAAKRALLEQAHVYCFPSHTEGMPVSLLEALAFGLPVVTRPVGGIAELFQDGLMGCAADGPDPVGIARLLRGLAEDRVSMVRMATYNHRWALEHCLASSAADRLLETYREACQAREGVAA